jgi:DNA-binding NarL/FixJ family response regulator
VYQYRQEERVKIRARILLVDDFAHWQYHALTILESEADFTVIGIATNGEEAVQKATQLQPHVVVLDVTLQGTSGLEAARQIRSRSAGSKILFLSVHSDPDIVEAAFEAGGSGYVLKSDSAVDLVLAVRAVLGNQTFMSRGLAPDEIA